MDITIHIPAIFTSWNLYIGLGAGLGVSAGLFYLFIRNCGPRF